MYAGGRWVLAAAFVVTCIGAKDASAEKTTVTVTNETPFVLDVIYKAVGCAKIVYDGVQIYTVEVCERIEDVHPNESVSYEFGGGTSGRKVWAEIASATCAGPYCDDEPQMMVSTEEEWVDNWNEIYIDSSGVGHHAMIRDGFAEYSYTLGDNYANSCAVSGFGILHDADVTWTKLIIQGENLDFYGKQFVADCGVQIDQPGALFVSLGECETRVENRLISDSGLALQQAIGILANNCTAKNRNKKHGHIVSCISRELNDLVKENVITAQEKGALHNCAARAREGF